MKNKSRKVLYLVAGLYLLYLSFYLISGVVEGSNGNVVASVAAGILFVAAGLWLIVDFVKALKKGFDEEEQEEKEEKEEEEE